ncbi:MAG: hypothetical protein ACXAC2_10240, partial [Candidatus Kariarchaeaceae archaeon]
MVQIEFFFLFSILSNRNWEEIYIFSLIQMKKDILYLYGFASGPLSTKAQFFKKKFHQKAN